MKECMKKYILEPTYALPHVELQYKEMKYDEWMSKCLNKIMNE